MGSQLPSLPLREPFPENCKLHITMPISSPTEQQQMTEIVQKRIKLSQCPYICTAKGYDFINEEMNRFTCNQQKQLIIYYDQFDFKLIDVHIGNYKKMFDQGELCWLIRCVVSALGWMGKLGFCHGDVSLENICKKGKVWKLIDKAFIKNGINAYQKVLEGQSGFISPKQMLGIRHGQIKESPKIVEADDIFALGMVVLQLASQVPSSLCYRQTRFNQDNFNQNLYFCHQKFSQQFYILLRSMLKSEEEERIKINQILSHPLIAARNIDNTHINLNLTKIKVSQLGQPSNSSSNTRSQMNMNINLNKINSDPVRKPLTPNVPISSYNSIIATQNTTKQPSPIQYNSSKTISMKSSDHYGNCNRYYPQTHRPQPWSQASIPIGSSSNTHQNTNIRQVYQSYYGPTPSLAPTGASSVGIKSSNVQNNAQNVQQGNTGLNHYKKVNSFVDAQQRLKTVN